MSPTNFDKQLAKLLKGPGFANRFQQASEEWVIALQLAKLRQDTGLSQAQLARKLKTSQQQLSRLESANYERDSFSMLRRVAEALDARVVDSIETETAIHQANEEPATIKAQTKKASSKTNKKPSKKARAHQSLASTVLDTNFTLTEKHRLPYAKARPV